MNINDTMPIGHLYSTNKTRAVVSNPLSPCPQEFHALEAVWPSHFSDLVSDLHPSLAYLPFFPPIQAATSDKLASTAPPSRDSTSRRPH